MVFPVLLRQYIGRARCTDTSSSSWRKKSHQNGCTKVVPVYLRTALTQCQSHDFTLERHMTSSGSITHCDVEWVFFYRELISDGTTLDTDNYNLLCYRQERAPKFFFSVFG